MEISRTAAGILALTCIAAGAGGGAFFALRSEIPPVSATERLEAPSAPAVEESEAVIAEEVRPVAPPAPAREAPPTAAVVRRPASPRPPVPVAAAPRVEPADPVARPVIETSIPVPTPVVVDPPAPQPVEPIGPVYEELVVAADAVVGLQLESPVTSERAQVEDEIVARVARDVRVADRIAIPSGARAFGEVTLVERGGRMRDRARLGVRFTSIVLPDGTRLPISTEAIYREGDAPGRESAAKIGGGAIGGAIIGGILGGAKGAAIGSSIGAGAGTATVLAGDRNHATLAAGTPLTVRLQEPVVVTVER
jgi:hypothetical protein